MAGENSKASGNKYFETRMKAARYNADFSIRRTAAEHLPGVEENCLTKYELGLRKPPNDVVAIMADAYNAPELRAWYCANECPLGRDCREIPRMPPERAVIRLDNALKDMAAALEAITHVMDDGKVNDGEGEMLMKAKTQLIKVKNRITEVTAVIEIAEKTRKFE